MDLTDDGGRSPAEGVRMIPLQGTLAERLEQAISLCRTEVTAEEVGRFHAVYEKAGIRPSTAAVEFFKAYGGVFRERRLVLSDQRFGSAVFFRCYGRQRTDVDFTDLDHAVQQMDRVREAAGRDVCPVALIGYDIPADVYVDEGGRLHCLYEFKEEIDAFDSPAGILESYLRNNVPVGVAERR